MADAKAFNISVVFRADTAAAKAGLAEFKREIGSIGSETGSATAAANQNASALTDNAAAAQRAAAAQSEYAAAAKRASDQVRAAAAAPIAVVKQALPANLSGLSGGGEAAAQSSALAMANARLSESYRLVGQDVAATLRETALYRQEMDAIRAQYNPLFAVSQRYEQELRDIAAAERLGAISASEAAMARERAASAMAPLAGGMRQVGASAGAAASYAANLSFQLNDIAMMTASGQSPFMLMIQQGPQVSQIFGSVAASGMSLGATLRAAFAQMLNPMGLIAMAAIGLGAAAVQAIGAMVPETRTLADAQDDLAEALSNVAQANTAANLSTDELREKYGALADVAQAAAQALLRTELIQAMATLKVAIAANTSEFSRLLGNIDAAGHQGRASIEKLTGAYGLTVAEARKLADLHQELKSADGPEAQAKAAAAYAEALAAAYGEYEKMPGPVQEIYNALNDSTLKAAQLAKVDMASGISAARTEASKMADEITRALSAVRALGASGAESLEDAKIRNQYVGDPVGAARALAMAQMRRTQGVLRDGAEGADLAVLESEVRRAGDAAAETARLDADTSAQEKARAEAARASRSDAKASARDAESVQDLIQSKRDELAILRATNPVQAELLRNREALAAATPKQRAELEQLIISYEQESDELNSLRQANAEVEASFREGFVGLITGADSFGDALGRLASRMADMAANSLFDSLWAGTGGSGGIGSFVTGLFGGTIFGHADGGQVVGAGGPREDNLLRWLSNGEYVVNAASTRENLPLIEAINAGADRKQLMTMILGGAAPRLADGGRVGSVSFAPAPALLRSAQGGDAAAASRSLTVNANIDVSGAQGDSQILAVVQRGVDMAIQQALSQYDREVLPTRINEVSNDPRRIG